MCGIAGVISWDDKYRVTRETLARMSARIAHRGPDGEGFYLNHEREVTPENPQCGFAFRRLAILDPDPRAMQPFKIGDKTIVFNGEIYNFRELRAELTRLRPEYPWRTTGDTEVLLLAYDAWGEKCLERLNGMFAFALWDERDKTLFLARDRMGQKPLYYTEIEGASAVAFASELAAVGECPFEKIVDQEAVREYLRWGYIPGTRSVYEGVRKLAPGVSVTIQVRLGPGPPPRYGGSWALWRSTPYFKPNWTPDALSFKPATEPDPVGRTRQLVRQSVARQMVSDVPLGCFLSGGVDSSVVAACMRSAAGAGGVHTFSVGFDDPRYDETEYAATVADHLGTRHTTFKVRPSATADLPELARVFGEPFGDSSALPTHYLSRETRARVKVALSGDGGDELFGGYDRYRALHVLQRLQAWPRAARSVLAAPLWRHLPGRHPKSLATRYKRFASSVDRPPARAYSDYVRVFTGEQVQSLVGPSLGGQSGFDSFEFSFNGHVEVGRDVVQAGLAIDREQYLPDDLLTKVDRASMLHSLEVRSPFLDHELVQFAAGLSTDQLLRGGPKRMLREAFADDLPAWVFKRKKMGFAVPIGEWFRGELRAMLRDNLFASDAFGREHFNMKVVERLVEEHERERVDHSQRLYALLMLELWWRTSR